MTKIAFTVLTADPQAVGALLKDPIPGIKVIPPKIDPGNQRGDTIINIANLTQNFNFPVTIIADLALITAGGVVSYLAGRLGGRHGRSEAQLNSRSVTIDNIELLKAEIEKLEQNNREQG